MLFAFFVVPQLTKALGICIEVFWISVDFLHEVTW